jgi:hypothetical protein
MDFHNTRLRFEGLRRTASRPAAALLVVALAAAGCSSLGSSSPKASGTTSSSSGSVPFGDRISSLFGGGSSQPPSDAAAPPVTASDIECPSMDIRNGASTLLVNGGGEGDALGLRYQGTFVRAARECRVQNGQLSIKVGVQGRIILGPAGGPGEVTVPLRMALVQETLDTSKPLWSKLYIVRVQIPPNTPTVNFTQIADDLTIPLPNANDLSEMTLYIGFDPNAPEAQQKKPAPKAAKPRRAAR